MKCFEYGPWDPIQNTLFSLKLANGFDEPKCQITLGWKGLSVTNAVAYWVHSYVTKKMKCCEYGPWDPIQNTSFSLKLVNGFDKPEHIITLGWKGLSVTNTLVYWVHL